MTPISLVAIILASSVLLYFVATATFSYIYPDIVTIERTRIWGELMAVLIGGLVAFISRGDK